MQLPFTGFPIKNNYAACFGTSSFILGIILLCLKTWLIELVQASMLVLKPNSQIENAWRKTPIEVPTDIYFFNWTNPEEFQNFSIKPKFEQLGPYRFMQNMEKVNVIYNNNNTVTYNQVRSWHFDQEHENGNLSDNVTTLNAISLSAAHYIRNWNYIIKKAASAILSTASPHVYISRTVNQFLFEGYDDFIVDLYNYLPFIASEIPRFNRFGWFAIRNASETFDGVFNMANGVDGNFEIRNWNYYNTTPYFDGSCAKVHGSGSELYSSKLSKDYVGIFVSDFCRYIKLDFEEEVTVKGILGYKYSLGDGVLDNGTLIPGNDCYCAGDCLPSGMINISSCRYGLPTFVSLPNFYRADPFYLNAVEGLQPEKTKHETYIVLEPQTGTLLQGAARLQLNVFIHPIDDISLYRDVPEVFFPLFWAQQKVTLPDDFLLLLKIFLHAPMIITGIAIVLITLGVYLLLFIAFKPTLVSLYKRVDEQNRRISLKPEEIPLQLDRENYHISKINRYENEAFL